jgi:spore germination protein PC
MYQGPISERFLQQLYTQLNWQTQKINQMDKIIQQLQTEINSLKKQPQINVEKIEYKFDQLKVETLEGTLNIGLSPLGSGSVEDFAVNHRVAQDLSVQSGHHEMLQPIQQHVHQYLNQDALNEIQQLEKKYRRRLEDSYRQFIIEDVKKQVDQRIHHYLHQMMKNGGTDNAASIDQIIIKKVKKDINNAMEEYIKNLPGKDNGSE